MRSSHLNRIRRPQRVSPIHDAPTAARLTLLLVLTFSATALAEAQRSRCADCHFANTRVPTHEHLGAWDLTKHLEDWETSPHGRNGVGCESCHGGDPTTFESYLAHTGILNSHNPASPTHRWNLPKTCGKCHVGPFVSFQDSKHFDLLQSGDDTAPTCATCHGNVAAWLLSPEALQRRCAKCHGKGRSAENLERVNDAKTLHEQVTVVRELLKQAQKIISRVDENGRRNRLTASYEQAEVHLVLAIDAAHEFVFGEARERLAECRTRTEKLLEELANPL